MANARIVNTPSQAIPQDNTTHQQVTVGAAAANVLNWTLNTNTQHVLVQFNGADCRVTFDGVTAPTATKGFLYKDGSCAYWTTQMLTDAKAIRTATTNVTVEIQELNYL